MARLNVADGPGADIGQCRRKAEDCAVVARERISAWVHRRSSGEQGCTYLTRFHLETGAPPSVPVKPVTVSSSPEIAMVRFCVVPVQFGNVAASIWMLTDFSASSTE